MPSQIKSITEKQQNVIQNIIIESYKRVDSIPIKLSTIKREQQQLYEKQDTECKKITEIKQEMLTKLDEIKKLIVKHNPLTPISEVWDSGESFDNVFRIYTTLCSTIKNINDNIVSVQKNVENINHSVNKWSLYHKIMKKIQKDIEDGKSITNLPNIHTFEQDEILSNEIKSLHCIFPIECFSTTDDNIQFVY